jgi:hypothetical protein
MLMKLVKQKKIKIIFALCINRPLNAKRQTLNRPPNAKR